MTKSLVFGAAVLSLVLGAAGARPIPAQAADVVAEWASVKPPPAPPLKPVTVDPKTTALLVMDFLPGGYCAANPRCVAALPAVKKLLDGARGSNTLVVYSIAGKFTLSDVLKEVAPRGGEPSVKAHADKFEGTDLEKILKDKGVQTVIVTGTAGNGAVLYTGGEAAMRGFNIIVPVDTLPSDSPYAEQLTVWELANGPGFAKQVTVTRSDLVKF